MSIENQEFPVGAPAPAKKRLPSADIKTKRHEGQTLGDETADALAEYEERRGALRAKYLNEDATADVMTGGVDHLAQQRL